MPKHLATRPPRDAAEERQVRKLAHSVHALADWIVHAVAGSPPVRMRQGGHLAARTPGTAAACGYYNGDGAGVGHAAALHGSPSGIASAPHTALSLTGFTVGDFVGYFCAASRDGL